MNRYAPSMEVPVAALDEDSRATFISRTYLHLIGAVLGMVAIDVAIFSSGLAEKWFSSLASNWMVVMLAFLAVGWLGNRMAHAKSQGVQYAGLAAYTIAEAIIFVPILYIANQVAPGAIESAALVTAVIFGGLSFYAMKSRKDFSFLGKFIFWGMLAGGAAIFGGLIFGFSLGLWFSVLMAGLASAAILYETSNILHHYPEDGYVGAALGLFASVAMLFFYILRIFLAFAGDD